MCVDARWTIFWAQFRYVCVCAFFMFACLYVSVSKWIWEWVYMCVRACLCVFFILHFTFLLLNSAPRDNVIVIASSQSNIRFWHSILASINIHMPLCFFYSLLVQSSILGRVFSHSHHSLCHSYAISLCFTRKMKLFASLANVTRWISRIECAWNKQKQMTLYVANDCWTSTAKRKHNVKCTVRCSVCSTRKWQRMRDVCSMWKRTIFTPSILSHYRCLAMVFSGAVSSVQSSVHGKPIAYSYGVFGQLFWVCSAVSMFQWIECLFTKLINRILNAHNMELLQGWNHL